MQHIDQKKKSGKKGRDTTGFFDNVTASMRVMQKTEPADVSQIYLLASAVAATTKDSVTALIYAKPPAPAPAPPVVIDVEEDSKRINAEFAKIEEKIIVLQQERSEITKQIKLLKDNKKSAADQDAADAIQIDPALTDRQLQILEHVDLLLIEKIKLIPEMIREHAMRRVDLFFLLSIAVYNKQVVIEKGATVLQHGQGSKKTGTAGCHASLIPNPMIEPIVIVPQLIQSYIQSVSLWAAKYLKSPAPVLPPEPPFTIKGTYLEDILNMTTELPTVVNDFDGQMEGKYEQSTAVNECIKILNRVAKGEIDPIQSLAEFCNIMKLFFDHMEYRYFRKDPPSYANSATILYPRATKLIWQYEKEGTFRVFNLQSQTPDPNYVHMMLKLQTLTVGQKAAGLVYSGYRHQRILDMQKEILSSKSQSVLEEEKKANAGKKSGKI